MTQECVNNGIQRAKHLHVGFTDLRVSPWGFRYSRL